MQLGHDRARRPSLPQRRARQGWEGRVRRRRRPGGRASPDRFIRASGPPAVQAIDYPGVIPSARRRGVSRQITEQGLPYPRACRSQGRGTFSSPRSGTRRPLRRPRDPVPLADFKGLQHLAEPALVLLSRPREQSARSDSRVLNAEVADDRRGHGTQLRSNRLPCHARQRRWSGRDYVRPRPESLPRTGTNAGPELSRVAHHHPALVGVMSSRGINRLRSDRPKRRTVALRASVSSDRCRGTRLSVG